MRRIYLFCFILAVLISGYGQDSFFEESSSASSALTLGGTVGTVTDVMLDFGNVDDTAVEYRDTVHLDMSYASDSVDIILGINIEDSGISEGTWDADVAFSEAFGRYYFGIGDFELGLIKPIWGSGDGVHVVDILTPMDYSRFIEPDYADRKQPMPMAKMNLDFQDSGRLELVYIPYFEPDSYPTSGPWVQGQYTQMVAAVEPVMEMWSNALYQAYYTAAYMTSGDAAAAAGIAAMQTMQTLASAEDSIVEYDNTKTPEYSQGALRYGLSVPLIDFSVIIGTVFLSEPVVTAVDMSAAEITTAPDPTVLDPHLEVSYNRIYVGGFDVSGELIGCGYRGEFAAQISEDVAGDDPLIHNPRLGWVFGIDRDFGIKGLYVNIQTQGEYILFNDKVENVLDTDYREDYSRNTIAAQLEAKPVNDFFTCAINGAYVVEDSSYRINPSFTYIFGDVFEVEASYTLYEGDDDSLFGQFDANDYLSVTGTLSF